MPAKAPAVKRRADVLPLQAPVKASAIKRHTIISHMGMPAKTSAVERRAAREMGFPFVIAQLLF
jgi:hypothetical protein